MKYSTIKKLSFDNVEQLYNTGCITQDQWEYYCWEWRNSTTRLSTICQGYEGKESPCPKPV